MADIRTLIPAGETVTLRRVGDFLFCKFSDRPLIVNIQDSQGTSDGPVEVKNGSMRRPPNGVSVIEVTNPDPANDCAAVFFVGKGDFDDKIIQGDVTVTPVLRKANGTTIADSRRDLAFSVNVQNEGTTVLAPKDIVNSGGYDLYDSVGSSVMVGGRLFSLAETYSPIRGYVVEWSQTGFYELSANRVDGLFPQASSQWPIAGSDDTSELIIVDRAAAFGWGQSDIYAINIDSAATRQGLIGSNSQMPQGAVVVNGEILISMGLQSGGQEIYRYRLADFQLLGVGVEGLEKDFLGGRLFDDGRLVLQCRDQRLRTYTQGGSGWAEVESVNMGSTVSGTHSAAIGEDTLFTHKTATTWQQVAWKNTRRTYGYPVNATCSDMVGALAKKSNLDAPAVSAAIVDSVIVDRRAKITGEVIRYALETYTGQRMPENYLDYVYFFRASNAASGGLNEEAGGGAETFKKAGIADNFSIYSPSVIHLTIDNDLLGMSWL